MNNKGADQTAQRRRLICTFVVRIWHKTYFCMTWPIFLVNDFICTCHQYKQFWFRLFVTMVSYVMTLWHHRYRFMPYQTLTSKPIELKAGSQPRNFFQSHLFDYTKLKLVVSRFTETGHFGPWSSRSHFQAILVPIIRTFRIITVPS